MQRIGGCVEMDVGLTRLFDKMVYYGLLSYNTKFSKGLHNDYIRALSNNRQDKVIM